MCKKARDFRSAYTSSPAELQQCKAKTYELLWRHLHSNWSDPFLSLPDWPVDNFPRCRENGVELAQNTCWLLWWNASVSVAYRRRFQSGIRCDSQESLGKDIGWRLWWKLCYGICLPWLTRPQETFSLRTTKHRIDPSKLPRLHLCWAWKPFLRWSSQPRRSTEESQANYEVLWWLVVNEDSEQAVLRYTIVAASPRAETMLGAQKMQEPTLDQ